MKKTLILAVALCLVAAGVAMAAISGSLHDLSTATSDNQTCVFCHHPHGTGNATLLWNRDNAGSTISDRCMSCHDGLAAQAELVVTSSVTTDVTLTGGTNLVDLTDDHPVEVSYAAAGITLKAQTTAEGNLSLSAGDLDVVSCNSCHDVHDGTAYASMLRADTAASAICTACHVQ